MRPFRLSRPLLSKSSLLAVCVGLALAASAGTAVLRAQDEDEEEDAARAAEQAKAAAAALEKAVARGKEIWDNKDGSMKKSCASCHDDVNKPNNLIKNRAMVYPGYSRRARGIVTLHQKVQEMVEFNSRGKRLDDKGTDIAALTAYVMSLKAPATK